MSRVKARRTEEARGGIGRSEKSPRVGGEGLAEVKVLGLGWGQ